MAVWLGLLAALASCLPRLCAQEPAASAINVARPEPGVLPKDEDGKSLNLDFEKGTLEDWTATGQAFEGQPIKGPIDPKRPFGADKRSDHTGEYWLGGFEKLRDTPTGTLTSQPFQVTHPYASFLIGGGAHDQTRVEVVRAGDGKVVFSASGRNQEHMIPVVVNLQPLQGEQIFVRVVDEHAEGWGHVNFDDFRFHEQRPEFRNPASRPVPSLAELYPHAGLDPTRAVAAMKVPEGFQVQLAAAEPDVRQPVALALDDRGRVWVAEALTYPTRAPEGEGKDRILVFEDTDLDGTLDKRTVFQENLNLVSGLEVGFGGVWVGSAPYLLFIPDRDHDDQPDGPPQVVLDGWGFEDTHETLNAFLWGPDGWLYGCHGVFTHSRVGKPGTPDAERVPLNAGIWRYHPVRESFEVFAQGTSNPWGVDFNDYGQAFCTACVIPHLFHVIQGARYERQAGQHFNPHTYDDIKTIADHRHFVGGQWNNDDRNRSSELGGGHAHAGAMIYLGGSWPEGYRNQIFMNNIHGNRVNVDHLDPQGSGYVGHHGPDFLLTGDQWSQMLNFRYGPDGQVWLIDWYDRNQCHRREFEVHDRSNGRIYRVAYGDAKPVAANLADASDEELAELQLHANDWYVRHARRLLQERAAERSVSEAARERLISIAASHNEAPRRLRALWALHVSGGIPESLEEKLWTDADPHVRGWAVQMSLEQWQEGVAQQPLDASRLTQLEQLARNDASPVVRLYLSSAAQRLPVDQRWGLVEALLTHASADAQDHNLPLMYWYALEPLAEVDASRALALAMQGGESLPRLQQFMVRRIGAGDTSDALQLLVEGLQKAPSDRVRLTYLRGLNEALRGRRQAEPTSGWTEAYQVLAESADSQVRLEAARLGATFGSASARAYLRAVVIDAKGEDQERQEALAALRKVQDAELPALLRGLLDDPSLRGAAIRALAASDDPEAASLLIARYPQLSPEHRRDVLNTLAVRKPSALALLDAVERNEIPAREVSADVIRQMMNLEDQQIAARIGKAWGVVRQTDEQRLETIRHYQALLTSTAVREPEPELGRAVFAKTCQQCHTLFGTGGDVGPDLTGSNRANLEYLLSNVLDPSAVMAREYQPSVIQTADGRVLTGIIKQRDADALVVQTANETLIVPLGEVEQMRQSDKSMMPDDLLTGLTEHEVRSLVSYLALPGQVPMRATPENVQSFFHGNNLEGWVGNPDLWSAEDGVIVGRSTGLKKNEFLVSPLSVEDFRLSFEVKLTPNSENSGVQFRSLPLAEGEVKGYQADIGAGWWGKLYEEHGRGLLWDRPADEHVNENEWNRYEVLAVGSRIRTWLNGEPCVDLEDPEGRRRGIIAFQLHSGGPLEIRFRDIQLELLDTTPASSPRIPQSRSTSAEGDAPTVQFVKRQLDDRFRSEGVAVGDFNNDGRLDIAAGNRWFEAPDWTPHRITDTPAEFNPKGYSNSFCNFATDVDGDGRTDLILVDFPGKQTWWFQNPGNGATAWKRHVCTPVTNNESPTFIDLDGDGQGELVMGIEGNRMAFASPTDNPYSLWRLTSISQPGAPGTDRFSHGLGVGDLNQDGALDILVPQGWWEAPAGSRSAEKPWTFHNAPLGEACSQMLVYDFDGDGDQDVLSSSAHRFGIWWHERTEIGWETHEIDRSFSQTHALCLADINGDGLPDFVTGKRYWAHNSNDPGGTEQAVLCWFELQRTPDGPRWIKHQFDHDSGVGTQFQVVDVNRDGLLDVVTSNKKGTFYFEQTR